MSFAVAQLWEDWFSSVCFIIINCCLFIFIGDLKTNCEVVSNPDYSVRPRGAYFDPGRDPPPHTRNWIRPCRRDPGTCGQPPLLLQHLRFYCLLCSLGPNNWNFHKLHRNNNPLPTGLGVTLNRTISSSPTA